MVEDTEDNDAHRAELRALTAHIVAAYLAHQPTLPGDLPAIVQAVHDALQAAGKARPREAKEARAPAVPIKQSVKPNYLVCLEDGLRMTLLKGHLRAAHGLTPDEYRAKWELPGNYPITAPSYSKRKSAFAREMGFGKHKGPRHRRHGAGDGTLHQHSFVILAQLASFLPDLECMFYKLIA